MQTTNIYQTHCTTGQRGMTTMPGMVALFAVMILVIQVDIPKTQDQLQQTQAMANTNTSVQLLSATLSHFNKHSGWPTEINKLKPYLPIRPDNAALNTMAKLATNGDKTELLFNANTHTHAIQLARQFSQLDIEIVNQSGDVSVDNSANTYVKIYLDATKYGQWSDYGPWFPADECPADTGKQTRYAQCKKNNKPFDWCLGDKAETRNCERKAEWIEGQYAYGACTENQQSRTLSACKKGWHDGQQVACNTDGITEIVACDPAYWQATWGHWVTTYMSSDWEIQMRSLATDTCIKGFVNGTEQDCDPSLKLPTGVWQSRLKSGEPGDSWMFDANEAFINIQGNSVTFNLETRESSCGGNCPPELMSILTKGGI